jgi:hypothetical protein
MAPEYKWQNRLRFATGKHQFGHFVQEQPPGLTAVS